MAGTRRSFLGGMIAAASAPYFVPGSALGQDGRPAPSNRVSMAFVGIGSQGTGNMQVFLRDPRVQPVAVCDVDANYRNAAREATGVSADAAYADYRRVVERKDIDAIMLATPDHWHAIIACGLMASGKDVYCEKPLSLTVAEGRIVADVAKKHDRIVQMGTWRRSRAACRRACELVRNGRLGKVHTMHIGVPDKFAIRGGFTGQEPPQPVPDVLDYSMWLGPSPDAPYTEARCHFNFRWINDYSAGYITDWGAHYMDVVQWALDKDESGPTRIKATGSFSNKGIYNAPETFRIEYTYGDTKAIMFTTGEVPQWGMRFEGEKGWVQVESATLTAEPRELVGEKFGEDEVHLYESIDHHANFIDCVLSRRPAAAPAEVGHRSATVCHLGTIALTVGREIQWDPKAEKIIGDDAAAAMLSRSMKQPWTLRAV